MGNLNQSYDGTAKSVTVTTVPPGLTVNLTYNGSPNAPTNAGSYTVVGTVNDANYQGGATNILVIVKAAATVTLGNLVQTYDGTAKSVSVTTAPPGLTVNVTYNGSASAPSNIGSYTVIGTINDLNYEGSATNTLVIRAPCLSVSADRTTCPMAALVPLHVRAFDCITSNAIPHITAVLWISTAGTTRTNYVTTDGVGQATVSFSPLAGEAGHYGIGAGLPNQPSPPAQGTFSIVGIGFSTNQAAHRLIADVWVTNQVELRNLTDVSLTGITATLVGAPPEVIFQAFPPATLPGYGTSTLTYALKSTAGGAEPTCQLRVTSAEGATNYLPVMLELVSPVPQLVVTPSSLHAAMLRGAQSVATFQVANVGGAASGDLEVLLPDPEPGWLGLVTSAVIPSLAPDGQAEVAVSLTPASGLTLGPHSGGVALWSTNAGQTDVPFQFDCVSALKGNLRVTVVDEFTYYAAGAPKVTNATVTLSDPYVGTSIVSAVTGADGVALFTNLTEAYYAVSVQANQHGSFGTVVLVPGNQTFAFTAFLARQMVSYRWIVTPTTIPDRYIFTLDTRFETDVPAPVMRVEPGALNLCNYPAETNVVNLTVFNSGLITAKAARLFFSSHPRFAITPLTEYLGDIAGGTHVVVPVIIRRLAGTNDGPSQIEAHLDWELPTGDGTRYYQVPIYVYNAGLHDCDPANPGSVPTSPPSPWAGGGWVGGSGSSGGGGGGITPGPAPGTSPSRPHITYPPVFATPSDPIVPVQVGLQLSQSAVLIRNTFEAFIEVSNGSTDGLTNLGVVIDIRDSTNGTANQFFGIRPPVLTGLNAVDGTGTLAPLASGQARWSIIPATNAAPTGATRYTVGGTLSYRQAGQDVQIPLFHVPIIVFPDARLVVDYFWERIVYSDDPFTPEIEPAVPFGVGVRMKNVGFGNAIDVQITSAQPQIVDNASGLLVGFQLAGTQVGTQSLRPSLTATLGDIAPGTNAVAAWWMTASLQGQFTNYSATFTHLDDLGNGNLSLVESIANHPLVHVVRATVPVDDGVPDFLANDYFPTNLLPDHLYLSDGSVSNVTTITNGVVDGPPAPGHTNVLLTASLPAGWVYLRIPDPAPGIPLSFVTRSGGTNLLLGWNVWTTHRIVHPPVGDPYTENFLHLLDYNSTSSYTLGYNVALYITSQPQNRTNILGTTATFSVGVGGTQPFAYQWLGFGTNLVGQTNATLTITNVQISDGGPYSVIVTNVAGSITSTVATLTVWVPPVITSQPQNRTNVVGESAIFEVSAAGTTPFVYQWFKNGTSLLVGRTNATLTIPNVQTNDMGTYSVLVSNFAGSTNSMGALLKVLVPPWICPVTNQNVTVGRQLVITNCAEAADKPITFSLGAGAPAGASITTNGIFKWTPSCAQGSTTNLIQVWATDSGTPRTSNSMTFLVTVPECIEVSLGNTVVLAGQTSSVPVRLLSTTALTNMAFTVVYPPERLTNFTITVNSPQVLTQRLSFPQPGQVQVSFTLPAASVLHGPTNVGQLGFTTLPDQSSAFVPLPITDVVGLKPGSNLTANAYGYPDRVVVVGPEPLLEANWGVDRQPLLRLYGKPGSSYAMEWRTNSMAGAWQFGWRVPMTNLFQDFGIGATNPRQFYRAYEFFAEPAILEIQPGPAELLPLLLYGRRGTNYVLESSPALGSQAHWLPQLSLTLSNSFDFLPPLPMTNRSMFFRAFRP